MGNGCILARERKSWRCWLGRRVLPPFLRLALFVAIFISAGYGVFLLWQKGMADPRFRNNGDTLSLAGAVRECPESHSDLERLGKRLNGRSVLDPMLLSEIKRGYGESEWIGKVLAVRRHFPNRVEVEFMLRVPMAQVRQGNLYWLVDRDAKLLPIAGGENPAPGLPEIIGLTVADIGEPPEYGCAWQDPGVIGALGLLRAFWSSPLAKALPIRRIVVYGAAFAEAGRGEPPKRRRFEIETAPGPLVRWGTFNEGDLPGELTSGEKMGQLLDLLRREEALRPGICFDVRTRLPGYTLLMPL